MKLEVSLDDREHEFLGSNVSIRAGGKTVSGFQISKKSNCGKYERRVYKEDIGIREYSLSLTPDRLSIFDTDNGEMGKYIRYALSGISSSPDINLIIARIDIKNRVPGADEVRMMADLLNISSNSIVVPPFVDIKKDSKFDIGWYIELIESMRDALGFDVPMACPIPSQASRKDVREIMSAVYNPCQVYVKDFFGQKILSPNNEMVMSEVMRGIRLKEKESGQEGSFLYAYDARPNPKNGNDSRFVEAQIVSSIGFNGMGPKRKPPVIPKDLVLKMGQSNPLDVNKLFNAQDCRLYSIREGTVTDLYDQFLQDSFQTDFKEMDSESIRNSVAAFNHVQRNNDLSNMSTAIREDKFGRFIDSKSTPEGMKRTIRKVSKKVIGE